MRAGCLTCLAGLLVIAAILVPAARASAEKSEGNFAAGDADAEMVVSMPGRGLKASGTHHLRAQLNIGSGSLVEPPAPPPPPPPSTTGLPINPGYVGGYGYGGGYGSASGGGYGYGSVFGVARRNLIAAEDVVTAGAAFAGGIAQDGGDAADKWAERATAFFGQ